MISALEKRERQSVENMAMAALYQHAYRFDTYRIIAAAITTPPGHFYHTGDDPFDDELAALEREYALAAKTLTQQFNEAAAPEPDPDGDDDGRPAGPHISGIFSGKS